MVNNRYWYLYQNNITYGNWVAIEGHTIEGHSSRVNPFIPVWMFADRDLWRAVCQRWGSRPALRPHSAGVRWHPWITARRRNTEQVGGAKPSSNGICAHLHLFWENDLVLVLCYRRNCIISAYYQQRETYKATLPNVSKKKRSTVKVSLF